MYFRKIQSILQKDNVDQYRALHEERRRAEDATEKAKEVIKVRSIYTTFMHRLKLTENRV